MMYDTDKGDGDALTIAAVKALLEEHERRLLERLATSIGPPQEWFSVKDAARLTGLSDKHIRRAMQCGNLPCSNVGTPDGIAKTALTKGERPVVCC